MGWGPDWWLEVQVVRSEGRILKDRPIRCNTTVTALVQVVRSEGRILKERLRTQPTRVMSKVQVVRSEGRILKAVQFPVLQHGEQGCRWFDPRVGY